MFISDGLAYLLVRCPTNDDMESYTKVTPTPSGEWKPSNLDYDDQWDDSDDNARFGANVPATSYTQSYDVLKSILSLPGHKAPSITFSDDVALTKSDTDYELFLDMPELDTRKFNNYDGFSIYPEIFPFGPNYI